MTEWITAILLPLIAGATILYCIQGDRINLAITSGDLSSVDSLRSSTCCHGLLYALGASYLLGLVVVMALLYASLTLAGGGKTEQYYFRMLCLVVFVFAIIRRIHTRAKVVSGPRSRPVQEDARAARSAVSRDVFSMTRVKYLLLVLPATLIVVKLWMIGAATVSVPLRGDDAISIWLYRAKVIATLNTIPLDPGHPYYLGGSVATYPVFCSLMAAWIPMVTGGWNESLAALPWLLMYLSLLCVVVGGLLPWCGSLIAGFAAYAAVSLPLVAIHVCRPGYADLPLAVFLAASTVQLLAWHRSGRVGDFVLAFVFGLAAALMKREGPALAVLMLLPLLIANAGVIQRRTKAAKIGMTLSILISVVLCGVLMDFSDQRSAVASPAWQPGVATAMVRHAFSWGSFLLLFPMAAVLLVMVAFCREAVHRTVTVVTCLLLVGFVAGIFLLTPQGRFALNDQTPSRLLLQIAPTMIVLIASSLGSVRARCGAEAT